MVEFAPAEAVKEITEVWPKFQAERERLDRLDRWWRWEHEQPHKPKATPTAEYQELMTRSITPWLGLVVTTVAQALRVEGFRTDAAPDESAADFWRWWQANGMDTRQNAVHRAALAYGYSFVKVVPGVDPLTGDEQPIIRGYSPRQMTAVYGDERVDDWPLWAAHIESKKLRDPNTGRIVDGVEVRLLDGVGTHLIHRYGIDSENFEHRGVTSHGAPVCPVVRHLNQPDLEGRTPGEVEPFIPVAARIDQTTFDRLVVQRFSSWVVRTISGMARPDGEDKEAAKLRLKVEDILVATDAETKFGSLPASDIRQFLEAKVNDIRDLAAVSQTPPDNLLGDMVNLSADAIASARAGRDQKVGERKGTFGESWEQVARLCGSITGDRELAADVGAQVTWADIESRSLAQYVDAYGKLHQMLGVPAEVLIRRMPGFTDQDIAEIEAIMARAGTSFDELLLQMVGAEDPTGALPAA